MTAKLLTYSQCLQYQCWDNAHDELHDQSLFSWSRNRKEILSKFSETHLMVKLKLGTEYKFDIWNQLWHKLQFSNSFYSFENITHYHTGTGNSSFQSSRFKWTRRMKSSLQILFAFVSDVSIRTIKYRLDRIIRVYKLECRYEYTIYLKRTISSEVFKSRKIVSRRQLPMETRKMGVLSAAKKATDKRYRSDMCQHARLNVSGRV